MQPALRWPWRRLVSPILLAVLPLTLAGCFWNQVPTQANPTCSWTTNPPADSDRVCSMVFHTLRAIATAERAGDNATIHRLVPTPRVAGRIVAHGRALRNQSLTDLHVVPSVALGITNNGRVEAGFYLLGKTRAGKYVRQEAVLMTIRGDTAYVVDDQTGEEW